VTAKYFAATAANLNWIRWSFNCAKRHRFQNSVTEHRKNPP